MKKILRIELVVGIIFIIGFLVWQNKQEEDSFSPQHIVEELLAMQPVFTTNHINQMMAIHTITNDFDVNQYFDVLDKLSLDDNSELSWIYNYGGGGGLPVIYVKNKDSRDYVSLQYLAALSNHARITKVDFYVAAGFEFYTEYLNKIHVEDSPEGFFQYAVLRISGGMFYVCWHDLYFYESPICSQEQWNNLAFETNQLSDLCLDLDENFRDLVGIITNVDFTPKVYMSTNTVSVDIVTFGPFQGMNLNRFVIKRDFPHTILRHSTSNMVDYTCGSIL